MKYTYNEALKLATEFFGNELSASVFISKYAMQDNDGMYDEATPDQLHDRLAKEFARIDSEKYGLDYKERYDVYFDAMKNFARVVPQGSAMAAIGNKYQTISASNCVVVDSPKDSMGGIMDTAKHLAQLMKRRCVEANTYVIIKGVGPTEIKKVRVGNEILSFDINTGENVFKKIKDVFLTEVPARDRISITYRDGTVLKTSKKHPVLVVSENGFEYRNAYDLKIHDKNITQYHNNVEVTSIEHDQTSWEYMDIEVEDTNNFFANSSKQGNYVVIHNCGVGLDISTLRPEGFKVNNAAKTTSGAWSFADLYSYVTRMTAQLGRRGALLVSLSVEHPDVCKFATSKNDLTKVTGANISVKLTNAFINAVVNNTEYEQRFPVEGEAAFTKKVNARDVWKIIVDSATKTADPGLFFWDNITSNLPANFYNDFKTLSTNPCGEIPLSAFDSCRLISLNLTGYVKNAFDENCYFDFDSFENDIRIGMQMADNLVDLELELINKIQASSNEESEILLWQKLYDAGFNGRRTGLGTHGLADALAMLKIKYDSEDGISMIDKIYSKFRDSAYDQSADLAKIRGPFSVYDFEKEKECEFIKRLPKSILDKMKKHGRRNISLLTQAPTGSVSIVSKCGEFNSYNISSGVEPVFRNSYSRRKKINIVNENTRVDHTDLVGDKWQEYKVFHSNVQNYLNKFNLSEDGNLPDYFVTSDQVSWEKRVKIQGVESTYIDHSISSTINLPRGTTSETVGAIYLEAWKQGLKGITVYVEGSKDGVLISDEEKKKQESKKSGRPESIEYASAPKRGNVLPCDIHQATIKGKKWVVLVGMLGNDPYELFCGFSENLSLPSKCNKGKVVKKGKGEYDLHVDVGGEDLIIKNIIKTFDNPEFAWTTRLVSVSLRHGVAIDFLVEQLSKDGGLSDINRVMSRILKKYIKDGQKVKTNTKCEGCKGTNLVYSEGCVKCMDCGFSKCN